MTIHKYFICLHYSHSVPLQPLKNKSFNNNNNQRMLSPFNTTSSNLNFMITKQERKQNYTHTQKKQQRNQYLQHLLLFAFDGICNICMPTAMLQHLQQVTPTLVVANTRTINSQHVKYAHKSAMKMKATTTTTLNCYKCIGIEQTETERQTRNDSVASSVLEIL